MQNVVVEAARFLATHADQRIALRDVADHVSYSPFHLARAFERYFGVPPGQYLAAQRFQRAKKLLLSSDERIIDVCYAVGFSSVGTFTTRFAGAVGLSPTAFRRLPDLLTDAPPRPVVVAGSAKGGGVVTGSVRMSRAASDALGPSPSIYVGLFTRRDPRGVPVAGALLTEIPDYVLTDVPPGTYWVLSSALSARADAQEQLVPARTIGGGAPTPVQVTATNALHRRDVLLGVGEDWVAPVVVALPALASVDAQDRRRQR